MPNIAACTSLKAVISEVTVILTNPEHRILITINLLIIRLIPYKNQFPQIDFGENEINLKKAKFAAHIQYKNAYF